MNSFSNQCIRQTTSLFVPQAAAQLLQTFARGWGNSPTTCGTNTIRRETNLETDLPSIAQLEVELARLDEVEVKQARGKES